MGVFNFIVRLTIVFVFSLISTYAAHAADIDGVWSTNKEACSKMFVKKGDNVTFVDDADMFGSGMIIQGGTIRGKIVSCKIKNTKQEGSTVHLLAACSTDIMLSDMQLSLQIVGNDKLSRIFPGMPEMTTDYFRCPF